jgi:hypothetical protein
MELASLLKCLFMVMAAFHNIQHKLRNQLNAISRTNKLHLSDVLFFESGDLLSLSVIAAYLKHFPKSVHLFTNRSNVRIS